KIRKSSLIKPKKVSKSKNEQMIHEVFKLLSIIIIRGDKEMTMEKMIEKMLIGGEWQGTAKNIDVYNPETNQVIGSVPNASASDMEEAIKQMKAAKEKVGVLPVHRRIEILQKAADLVDDRIESFAKIIALEGSKTITEARDEAGRTTRILQMSAEEARRINGETISFDQVP